MKVDKHKLNEVIRQRDEHLKLSRLQNERRRNGLCAVYGIGGETYHRTQARILSAVIELVS